MPLFLPDGVDRREIAPARCDSERTRDHRRTALHGDCKFIEHPGPARCRILYQPFKRSLVSRFFSEKRLNGHEESLLAPYESDPSTEREILVEVLGRFWREPETHLVGVVLP